MEYLSGKAVALAIAIALAPALLGSGLASSGDYKSTVNEVELTGTLRLERFKSEKGRLASEIVLALAEPINVDKDEFHGPIENVARVQLVLSNGRIRSQVRRLVNKRARVKGILFHANSDAHLATVLMDVKKITRLSSQKKARKRPKIKQKSPDNQ